MAEAAKQPEISDEDKEKEFLLLLAILWDYFDQIEEMDKWELIEMLSDLRTELAFGHALKGFNNMSLERALELIGIEDEGSLTDAEKQQRKILIAAISNIAEFAVAEEYQMINAAEEVLGDYFDLDDIDEIDEETRQVVVSTFKKYNNQYATVENLDIEYSMSMAWQLALISGSTQLMYMTQGDERVRPWHLQFEGYTAPKAMFPSWLIPPIEHQCRCYLVEFSPEDRQIDFQNVSGDIITIPEMPDWFNRTFKESVATGGRIFSDEHPYFDVAIEDSDKIVEIVGRIRQKYNLQ